MEQLYLLAKGHTLRFPDGNEPFQIATRLLEECGEVAKEVWSATKASYGR